MPRTITVKGIGKTSAKPDYVVISMLLESQDQNYDRAMDFAAQHLQHLNEALAGIGFAQDCVKTTNFNVRTDYDRVKDACGNWKDIFNGYVVSHNLKLAFDFDMGRLSNALGAIAGCLSHPQLSVAFTVKDPSAIKDEMLRDAAANAKHKAGILCEASGVQLGSLLNIDYNWSEINIYSKTRYAVDEDCLYAPAAMSAKSMEIQPEDIDVSDTATFVWEIVPQI